MKLAVCIGINDYPGTANDLSGCRNDAEDWSAALQSRGFTTRRLLDEAASGEAIRTAIRSLLSQATTGDAVVITYSGHGTWLPDTNGDEPDHRDEALCPHDIAENGPLLDDELHDLFALAPEGVRTVLISDSCHSGTLTRLAHAPTPPLALTPLDVTAPHVLPARPRFLPPSTFLPPQGYLRAAAATKTPRKPDPRPTALLLSGCTDPEYSYDATFDGRPNGAFTYVALTTLAGLPPKATYRDWLNAIRATLPSETYPQTPSLQATKPQLAWPLLS
ncbi:caspase family protein [Dactylosporangium sp. CA-233914]|uniref:caspase family protein n=1 Tax=Dactylosporangium sp. CA-233914 TaxID=3239934 RepID=UPI003D91110F